MTKRDRTARYSVLTSGIDRGVQKVLSLGRQVLAEYVAIGAMASEYIALKADEQDESFDWKSWIAEQVPTASAKTHYRILNGGAVARVILASLAPEGFDVAAEQDEQNTSPLAGVAYTTLVPLYRFLKPDSSEEIRTAGETTVIRLWKTACEQASDGIPQEEQVRQLAEAEQATAKGPDGKTAEERKQAKDAKNERAKQDSDGKPEDGEQDESKNSPTDGEGSESVTLTVPDPAMLASAVTAVSDQIDGLAKQAGIPALKVWTILSAGARIVEEHSLVGLQAGLAAYAKQDVSS